MVEVDSSFCVEIGNWNATHLRRKGRLVHTRWGKMRLDPFTMAGRTLSQGGRGQADERGSGARERGLIGVVPRRQAKRLQCWPAFIRIHPHLQKRRTGPRARTRRRGRACICPGPNGSKSSAASGAPSTVRTHPADHRGSRVIAVQRDRLALNHPSVEGQAHRPIRCNELAQMRHAPP